MNIIATVALDGQPLYGDSWQLRAYAPDGELRGVSQLCAERHYLTIHGEEAVALRLEVVNLNTGEAFPADQTLTFADGILGSRQEPVVFHAATVTGIHPQTRTDAETQTVYDLQGRRLSGTSLPKGTYIVNGRKHVVK
jgi:hypothetical protein